MILQTILYVRGYWEKILDWIGWSRNILKKLVNWFYFVWGQIENRA
jgi:hypothetical protein